MKHACTTAANQMAAVSGSLVSASPVSYDRSMNFVLFEVQEDKDVNVWRTKVDSTFQTIAGRSVEIDDVFRLGRFRPDETRPILIKLRSAWDRRILLNGSRKF